MWLKAFTVYGYEPHLTSFKHLWGSTLASCRTPTLLAWGPYCWLPCSRGVRLHMIPGDGLSCLKHDGENAEGVVSTRQWPHNSGSCGYSSVFLIPSPLKERTPPQKRHLFDPLWSFLGFHSGIESVTIREQLSGIVGIVIEVAKLQLASQPQGWAKGKGCFIFFPGISEAD